MSGILGVLSGQSGGAGPTKCADVVLSPNSGTTPLTVSLSTSTVGAHIFYTKRTEGSGVDPTHAGDNATGVTIRIGSNSGSVDTGAGNKEIRALAYSPSFLDSDITSGVYETGG